MSINLPKEMALYITAHLCQTTALATRRQTWDQSIACLPIYLPASVDIKLHSEGTEAMVCT